MEKESEGFVPPEVAVGDQVYWYADALHPSNPALGWIKGGTGDPRRAPEDRPKTVTILVCQADGSMAERTSVRHKDDPGLIENQRWRDWGCWELSKSTAELRKIVALLPGMTALLARSVPGESTKHGKG